MVTRPVRRRVRAGRAPPVQEEAARGAGGARGRPARPAPRATPSSSERVLDRDQARLYRLIWQRAVASQMAEARFDQVSVDIGGEAASPSARYLLRATGQTMKFDGFRRVYFEGRDDTADEDAEAMLPAAHRRAGPPPARAAPRAALHPAAAPVHRGEPGEDAGGVRDRPALDVRADDLDDMDRGYVRLEDKRFFPEDIGMVVTDILVDLFPRHRRRGVHRPHGGGAGRHRRGQAPVGRRSCASSTTRSTSEVENARAARWSPRGRPGRAVPALSRGGSRARPPGRKARPLRGFIGLRELPRVQVHPPDGGRGGAPSPSCWTRPARMRAAAHAADRPVRPVRRLLRLPGVQVHQEGAAEEHRRHLPAVRQGELVERKGRFGPSTPCERYPECEFSVNQTPLPEPCPSCQGLVVAARGGARRCTACGKAWDADGDELPEDEAKALVPKPRASATAAAGGVRDAGGRPRPRSPADGRRRPGEPSKRRSTPAVATVAEEIAALRGTKPAALQGPTGPPMVLPPVAGHARLLAGGLGRVRGRRRPGGPVGGAAAGWSGRGRRDARPAAAVGAVRPLRRRVRRPVRPQAGDGRRPTSPAGRCTRPCRSCPGCGRSTLLSFFIECLSLIWTPAKDASVPEPGPTPATLERQLGRPDHDVRDPAARGDDLHGPRRHRAGPPRPYFGSHPEFLALWLDAFTFLFSAWMIWGLDFRGRRRAEPARKAERADAKSAPEDIAGFPVPERASGRPRDDARDRDGLRRRGAVISLGPIFARYSLNAGSTGFGFLITALGVGMGPGWPRPNS